MLLGFLIFVVLLSGLVAYSADTIARRAGRRHLRLFGLRPKTTALIVAVASGMGISLASVLAYGVLNRTAITNIQQADRLRIELSQLKKDVKAVGADLTAAEQERDAANRRVLLSRRETAQAQTDLQSAESKLKTTQAARSQLAGEVSGLQARVTRLGQLQRDLQTQADASSQALAKSQTALSASRQREQEQALRLSLLGSQIVELDKRSSQSVIDARSAQARAEALQTQIQTLEASRAKVQTQLKAAQTGRDQAVSERKAAQAQSQQAQASLKTAATARDAAIKAREEALQARDLAQAQQASLAAERDNLAAQRKTLLSQRDAAAQDLGRVRAELGTLQTMVGTLEGQRRSLAAANDALRSSLSSAQANLSKLEVDYSRTNSELSASRNTDLIYSRNDLVYAGVVASVRNLPDFLKAVSAAAQKQGAGGTPAAQLPASALTALETKLRGLNTNTFVQCRAAVNVALGFPVDLSCDARPQSLLFRRGQIISQASINLQSGTEALSSQLTSLIRDAVFELTSRGVPPEYINDLGLSDTDRLDILGKLGAQSGSSATVALAARDDVRLGNRVDLYPLMK